MNMWKTLPVIAAFAFAHHVRAAVLVDLDATALPSGAISAWENKASAGGGLTNATPIRVEKIQNRAAVVFDGKQQLVSDFTLPAGFEKKPFTVEVWALNPSVEKAETMIAFTRTNGGPGTEFSFSSGPTAGAFRSGFKATTPFDTVPSANEWHHLAWTCTGEADGALRVYVDGELNVERPMRVTLLPQLQVRVGASGEVDRQLWSPRKGFSGAIARVRIHDVALTQSELREGAGLRDAFASSPRPGATTDALQVVLRWQRGTAEAASFAVYSGTNRVAVERGDKVLVTTANPQSEPVSLQVGATWFWRVAQLDKSGKVLTPGVVWSFTADAGLSAEPQPRSHDGNLPATTKQLAWRPGKYAVRQHVFFGTNSADVAQTARPAAELAATANSFAPPTPLAPGTRYYWRVDSDNGAQPLSRGPVWSFRTQDAPVPKDVTFFVGSDTHYGRENNAAINRRVIDEMNALPGTPLPSSVGGGFVRTPRGVVLNGDLLDEGFVKDTAPAHWAEFCRDYGLTGRDGRLCFPVYEGFGNHDGGPTKSIPRAGIKERNRGRVGVKSVSENGLHYAWDWDHVHLAQLNLFGGSGPADVKGVNGVEHDPQASLEFLRKDLADHVGNSGRPIIVFQHFAWFGGMSDWWHPEAKERFYDVVKSYKVAALINGHSHGGAFIAWHDLLTIHDGSTARGESDTGDFMVVRVTEKELTVIQRKLGEWGMARRQLLGKPTTEPKP